MAGHSHSKNIARRKTAQDKKKAKLFTKVLREIALFAQDNKDLKSNFKLKNAVQEAKSLNVPKSSIEKAIKGSSEEKNERILYEGYIEQIAFVIEAYVGNKNKAVSEIRQIASKFGAIIGKANSARFLFYSCTEIKFDDSLKDKLLRLEYIEVFSKGRECFLHCKIEDTPKVLQELENIKIEYLSCIEILKPFSRLDSKNSEKIKDFFDRIFENDCVNRVWHNLLL